MFISLSPSQGSFLCDARVTAEQRSVYLARIISLHWDHTIHAPHRHHIGQLRYLTHITTYCGIGEQLSATGGIATGVTSVTLPAKPPVERLHNVTPPFSEVSHSSHCSSNPIV